MVTKIPIVRRLVERTQQVADLALSTNDQRFYSQNWQLWVDDQKRNIAVWRTFIRSRGLQRFQDEFRIVRHGLPIGVRYIVIEAIREEGGFATARGFMATGRRKA